MGDKPFLEHAPSLCSVAPLRRDGDSGRFRGRDTAPNTSMGQCDDLEEANMDQGCKVEVTVRRSGADWLGEAHCGQYSTQLVGQFQRSIKTAASLPVVGY